MRYIVSLTVLCSILLYATSAASAGDQVGKTENQRKLSTVITQIPTLCASTKNDRPPDDKCVYKVGKHPEHGAVNRFLGIVANAGKLEQSGQFNDVPLSPSRRAYTIAQMAIWTVEGEKTGHKEDAVTKEGVLDDLLQSTGTPKQSLTKEQLQAANSNIDRIIGAIDLTLKDVPEPPADIKDEEIASKQPSVCSPIDNTVCSGLAKAVEKGYVKIRIFGDGETTSYVQLEVTNLTELPVYLEVAKGLVFSPECKGFQHMMVTETIKVALPASKLSKIRAQNPT